MYKSEIVAARWNCSTLAAVQSHSALLIEGTTPSEGKEGSMYGVEVEAKRHCLDNTLEGQEGEDVVDYGVRQEGDGINLLRLWWRDYGRRLATPSPRHEWIGRGTWRVYEGVSGLK